MRQLLLDSGREVDVLEVLAKAYYIHVEYRFASMDLGNRRMYLHGHS